MAQIAKKYNDKLDMFKDNIKSAHDYLATNMATFNNFKKFVYLSSLDKQALANLQITKKPNIEVNVMEAYISRLMGEFSKQMPSVTISSTDGVWNLGNIQVPAQNGQQVEEVAMIDVISGHMRYTLNSNSVHTNAKYKIYNDLLTGGFSVAKVYTEYEDPRGFNQSIKFKRVEDPLMVGYDPCAREQDKSDGKFWYELIPFTKEDFEAQYDIDVEKLNFYKIGAGLNFSYTTKKNEKRLLLCEYYEKQKKYKKLLMMAGGLTVYDDDLDAFRRWFSQQFPNQVLPQVIKDRKVETNIIHFYRFIEDRILEHRETDFPDFPLIYFDGNSVEVRGAQHTDKENDGYVGGNVNQYTRPYMWHALGVQKFKNFGLQCLANEFENMPQHKWIAPLEGMIADYKDAYINPQIPTTMIYRQFMEKDPAKQLNPPMAVQRPPIPPEIAASIQMADQMMQTILGSYDAALGINNNELSGIAIVEAATQSNAAAMPYIISFLQGLNSVANLILKLIPKYYITPRTIPIINNEGQHDYIQIQENTFKFSDNSLNVKVEAGANFAIQKDKQMKVLMGLMQALPTFAQFVDQAGIPIILENLEINGIDKIIAAFKKWQTDNKVAMQQQQQMAAQMNPQVMNAQNDAQRIQMEQQQNQTENQLKAQELRLQQEQLNIEQAKVQLDAQTKNNQSAVQVLKAHTEQMGQQANIAMKNIDMQHRHEKEHIETVSKITGQMMPKIRIES